MEMLAAYYPPGYDLPISTFFWGAVIVVALVAACLLVGKAIGPRNRRKVDGAAVGGRKPQRPPDRPYVGRHMALGYSDRHGAWPQIRPTSFH